jgi:hypothetical protein
MASASLIILGDSLDPTTVTRLLKLKSSQQWKKGERKSYQRRDGSVRFFDTKYKWGGWKLWPSEKQRKQDLRHQVDRWLALLSRKRKELAKIRASGCQVFLDCCIIGEADSVCLPPETLGRMAQLKLTFEVTFYSASDKEPNQTMSRTRAKRPRRLS